MREKKKHFLQWLDHFQGPGTAALYIYLLARIPDASLSDGFLFGTDEVAPANQEQYLRVYYQYEPLWKLLDKEAKEKVRKENYVRLFDDSRQEVRAWERAHVN
ncbi:MAG TPA: hypothetical protein VHT28_09380 [Silvibacterium sp.]|nr:hypothetical protein [Silvibacterium sp.]